MAGNYAGGMLGSFNILSPTPAGAGMIALISLAFVFLFVVRFTIIARACGLFEKFNSNEVRDPKQYRRIVKQMSRVGLELREKNLRHELTLYALDEDSRRRARCELCGRLCHEANFGSARSALRGAVSDGGGVDDFMCVDCFALVDVHDHELAHKIVDDFKNGGGGRAASAGGDDGGDGGDDVPLRSPARAKHLAAGDDDVEAKNADGGGGDSGDGDDTITDNEEGGEGGKKMRKKAKRSRTKKKKRKSDADE